MRSEDQAQKDVHQGEQAPPAAEEPKKRDKKKWLIIILILLLLLGLVFGWLWWKGKDDSPKASTKTTPSIEDTEKSADGSACVEGFTRYDNEELDISFCYPTTWGDVSQNDARFAAADTGSRWRLGFSAKPEVNVGLASVDWATEVPRDGVCVDPAVTELPAFEPFETEWITTMDDPVSSGSRGITKLDDEYLIRENVDSLLTSGVCLEGFKTLDESDHYDHAAASYSVEFNEDITNPAQHIADPNVLIPSPDRGDFKIFVDSMRGVL